MAEFNPTETGIRANAWAEGFWVGWNAATNGKWGDPPAGEFTNPFNGEDITES